jgi:hypothetical protein
MTEVNITPFDNEISILYKWARHYKTPIKLILITPEIIGDKEINNYSNGIDVINRRIYEGKNLREIYQEFGNRFEIEDVAMVYGLLSLATKPGGDLTAEINKLYATISETEEEGGTGKFQIKDEEELRLILADWRQNLEKDFQKDMEDLDDLETVHNELNKYAEVLYSPIKVDKVTIKAAPLLKSNSKVPTSDDALIMFDQAKTSYNVPYIRYNGEGTGRQELFKLYQGRTDEEMPDYKIVVPASSQTNKDNSFYFTVWSGKGTLTKSTKESYMKGSYDLSSNLLTIKTPTEEDINQQTIIGKISEALSIDITNVTETAISGEFFLFDLDINDIYLVYMIINTELMGSYLFVKETNTPYAEKTQLKVYYKSFDGFVEEEEKVAEGYIVNPSSVTVSLTQNYSHGGEVVFIQTETGPTKFRLPSGLPYVRAKITQAESLDVANKFAKIFSRLMQFYKTEKANVERLFINYIPELEQPLAISKPVKITVKQPTGKKGVADSKIERLKEAAPDLFVNGYARKCQCVFQPIVVPDDEVDAWRNNTFVYKETVRQRQVMSFPPDNPKWNFVCPNDSAPFPGVKLNKDLSNKEIYPCVPCCFKDDQMDPEAFSNYNECYKGKIKKVEEKPAAKETHKIKTDKILAPGRYGHVPKSIAALISKYSEESVDISRLGVPNSVNSLLHCISVAVRDPGYLNLSTIAQKEDYVTNIRKIISRQTLPTLVKQEMYDFSYEEIADQLNDHENFLDPSLFYRAVEESYNVNIYVFAPPDKEDDPGALGSFDLPRFKLFHVRAPRPEKRAILIFKTWGAESDALNNPQCELIVDQDEENNKVTYSFGQEMNNLLHNALMTLNRTITWELNKLENQPTQIIARNNIYSRENYFYLLNKSPTHQIIDGYGKTRGFIFPVGEHQITILMPSTQPENLPIGQIIRVEHDIAVSVFGLPRATTRNNGNVDGLWYQVLDLEYGIYIPINPTVQYKDLPVGPSNPLVEEGLEVVKRVRKLRRDLDTIVQVIKWLYLLSKLTVPEFINRYISIGQTNVDDSSKVYDLSKISIKLPEVTTVNEGIEQIKRLSPSLVETIQGQDRIYLYSQKFFDGIVYLLNKYDYEGKPRNPVIPKIIYRSDISEEDFTPQRRVSIFTDERDMKTWLNTLDKLSFKNIIIEDALNISNALRSEPYLYTSPTGNIYLIQNVIGGERLRAINVAYNWYTTKINPGHTASEFDTEATGNIPVYVVYGISPALAPVIIENNAGDATQYLQVLSYGSNQYAAMLPLL